MLHVHARSAVEQEAPGWGGRSEGIKRGEEVRCGGGMQGKIKVGEELEIVGIRPTVKTACTGCTE
jgi:hypothetical protein